MGNCVGHCMFRCGYTLYADTCVGRCLHQKYIDSFKKQFGEGAIHTKLTPFIFNDLLILPIPVLTSNYAYMVADMHCKNFVFVDVGDPTLIKNVTQAPDAILTTHKHWDHSGGNRQMRAAFPGLKVYGGAMERVPDSTHTVNDGDTVSFGRLKFTAIHTPGHTRGHIVWLLHGEGFGVCDSAFTGDHVMLAGCGAAFEGPLKQMIASLELITNLPNETLVWPGHEMGQENLEMAYYVEPDNLVTVLKLVWAFNRRDSGLCTCPSTIGEEKLYNPFLRTNEEALWKSLGVYDEIANAKPALSKEAIGVLCFGRIISKSSAITRVRRGLEDEVEKKRVAYGSASSDQLNSASTQTITAPQLVKMEHLERATPLAITRQLTITSGSMTEL